MRGRKPNIRAVDEQDAGTPPSCPKHLDAEARKEWRRVTRRMRETSTIDQRDRALIAVYAQAWSRMIHAETELAKTGPVVKSPAGFPMQSPWLTVVNQSVKVIERMAAELGLSPVSRTRIKTAKPKPKTRSAWAGLLADGQETVRIPDAG